MAVVTPAERTAAASFTAVPRSLAAALSPALSGAALRRRLAGAAAGRLRCAEDRLRPDALARDAHDAARCALTSARFSRCARRRSPRRASPRGSLATCAAPRVCTTTSICTRSTESDVKARWCCTSSMLAPRRASSAATSASAPGTSRTSTRKRASRPDLTMPRSMISARTSGSMLPPQRTRPTFLPAKRRGCFISAARPTAPAPSTTVFSISSSIRIACSMSSSETRTTSSTSARITGR